MLQVGFRPENIMIAANSQPESVGGGGGGGVGSSAYHCPSLPHAPAASTSVSSTDQWASGVRPLGGSGASTPVQPSTSCARGAPPPLSSSSLRHAPTSSSSSTTSSSQPPSASASAAAAPPSSSSSSTTGGPTSHCQPTPIPLEPQAITENVTPEPDCSSSATIPSSSATTGPATAKRSSEDTPPLKLHNLSHVVDLAKDHSRPRSPPKRSRSGGGGGDEDRRRYEISGMPVPDVIEMVAGLLTKITTTNDRQHDQLHRTIPLSEATVGLSVTTNSVLAFHGKNVPSITILSYLSRIHKYCPTTYEVFLSLLVYFDRMTERVNKNPTHNWRTGTVVGTADATSAAPANQHPDAYNFSHFFVVDSFNIHRLVIAGVTCASKFFSDVFYTNSRYAKVGGLPLAELNHLELQFLILNDFRLSVPVEELEAYGTMLVQFYAREAVSNTNLLDAISPPPPPPTPPIQEQQRETTTVVDATRRRGGGLAVEI